MPISSLLRILFISLLTTIITIPNISHAYDECLDEQKALLFELKNELIFNSPFSTKLVGWNQSEDCCSWKGVECDGVGRVIGLQLNDEGISGGLENSSSLFHLRHLKKLNLAWNKFNGSPIPRGIGNLTYLTHLNLSDADFGGQVPVELSLLTRLVSLDISSTKFMDMWDSISPFINTFLFSDQDVLPDMYISIHPLKLVRPNLGMLLQNLTRLRNLNLDGVDISAQQSEWDHVISSSLPRLRKLSLRHCGLLAPLDPSLSQFHSLTVLRLDGNDLSTVVPTFFANFSRLSQLSLQNCSLKGSLDLSNNLSNSTTLSNLISLNLGHNSINGGIPQSLFALPSLETLTLSHNQFTGQLNEFPTSNLSLVNLDIGYNSLSGRIPQSLFDLPSLQTLILSNNHFSGQVNEFTNVHLYNMTEIDMSNNQLHGPPPKSFFQLESLEVLRLSHNFFSGPFPLENIQRLGNLVILDLSYNSLSVEASSANSSLSMYPQQLMQLGLASCNMYFFPDFIKQFSTLISLDLSSNQIAGEIPSWIWEIGNAFLWKLNLSCNLLEDLQRPYHIPSSLEILDVHSNKLRGEFSLPVLPNIVFFNVANNSLTGSIPTSLCNSTMLSVLDMSVNNLSGNIPSCLLENIEVLQVVNLGRNNISGNIPDNFSVNCSLHALDLSNNNLAGNIPFSLANCKSLMVMNVGNNNITDSFPCMLPSSLEILLLRFNRFHGEVKCRKSWPKLQIIDIAFNNFSGNLYPESFSSWRRMMQGSDAHLGHNHSRLNFLSSNILYRDEVTLTIKGVQLKLVKIWPYHTSIDFSSNNFSGEIPDAIGDLNSVYLLNLSHNTLTGAIPKSLGNMSWLESLDLSVNQLSGVIPTELAGLTFLGFLNLSYNELVGKIPTGRQLQTFSPASFEGNIGLCGDPLNISCSAPGVSPPKPGNAEMTIEWGYVFAALGYVVGIGCFVLVLLSCRNLRRRYFEKIDEVLEKIFNRHDRKRRNRRRVQIRNQVRRR